MVNIKVYDFSSEDELETKINLLAEELEEHNKEIIDIKYSTSHFYDENYGQVISFSDVIKASDNLIDLTEEGDYVNGSEVEKITTFNGMNFVDTYMTQGYGWGTCIPENKIQSIRFYFF